jgi:hypothetical protein
MRAELYIVNMQSRSPFIFVNDFFETAALEGCCARDRVEYLPEAETFARSCSPRFLCTLPDGREVLRKDVNGQQTF